MPELSRYTIGLCNLHLLHTSAGLCINENWDPTSRTDLSTSFDRLAPESLLQGSKDTARGSKEIEYEHSAEGPDDMPSHVKSTLSGVNLTLPIADGDLKLGTWQDVQLCEYRRQVHTRKLVVTIQGELRE